MRKRWWVLIPLLALTVVVAVLWTQRADVARRLLPDLLARNFLSSLQNDLGEGLHVLLCGSGGPMADAVRSGPCLVVMAGNQTLVFDAGSGAARSLMGAKVDVGAIDAVFLTHFHSDHIDGLGELALNRWVRRANRSPLPVEGPMGVTEVVVGLNRVYGQDARYRQAHHGNRVAPLSGAGMVAHPWAPPEGSASVEVWREGGVSVEAFAVDHAPVEPAVGYRVTYAGRSVVISGDTSANENVARFSQDADVLFHEALSPELVAMLGQAGKAQGDSIVEQIMIDIPDYHTTPVEAAEIAARAGVGHLVYYHIVPPLPLPGMDQIFLEGVAPVFDEHTLGVDGLLVSLPPNSDAINIASP
ncbi:MAG: MBL fold metallo-hydrolase [Halieaceae bacterium]|jgi:ribonuclease Z|nr:MBL fold metallo-hydrolase [Halieaceae bacterium]